MFDCEKRRNFAVSGQKGKRAGCFREPKGKEELTLARGGGREGDPSAICRGGYAGIDMGGEKGKKNRKDEHHRTKEKSKAISTKKEGRLHHEVKGGQWCPVRTKKQKEKKKKNLPRRAKKKRPVLLILTTWSRSSPSMKGRGRRTVPGLGCEQEELGTRTTKGEAPALLPEGRKGLLQKEKKQKKRD